MNKRLRSIASKSTRIILIIYMILSSLGFNGLALLAEATTYTGEMGTTFGNQAYGYRFREDDGSNSVTSLSYATGDSANPYMFCIQSGAAITATSFTNPTPSGVSSLDDPIAGYMYHKLIINEVPDHRNHAAMAYYIHMNHESTTTSRDRFIDRMSNWQGKDPTTVNSIITQANAIEDEAIMYAGPYTLALDLTQIDGQYQAQGSLTMTSASNVDMSSMNIGQLIGGVINLTITNGAFVIGTTSSTNITLQTPADLANYTITAVDQTKPIQVKATISNLPSSNFTRYTWANSQNMTTLTTTKGTSIETSKDLQLKQIKFKPQGTTEANQYVKSGQQLSDKINITIDRNTWPTIIGTNNPVPAKFAIDWYYSVNDYGTVTIDVAELSGYSDIKYIGTDEATATNNLIVTAVGTYTVTSSFGATVPGFYYPVLKLDYNTQNPQNAFYEEGFQAQFNEVNEQTIQKWKPKVKTETTITQLSPEGGKVADKLTVTDNKDGHEITIASRLVGPFLTKPDFIGNENNHEGGSIPIPAGVDISDPVETTITGNETKTSPEIEVTEKGWYVWVEEIAATNYTEDWHSDFGSTNEYVVVPWKPSIETTLSETTSALQSQVYDTISVSDLPGLWGLANDGLGNLAQWDQNYVFPNGSREPDKDGNYALPAEWGTGEDTALEATFTMYYSATRPERGAVPDSAVIFDQFKAPLVSGVYKTKLFKAFDKPGWYTVVVSGGSTEGRLAKFETEYGIPSETTYVPPKDDEEYYTKVNSEKVLVNAPVYDTLHVNKAPINGLAEVTFTLYKYSDQVDDFNINNSEKIATSEAIPIDKYGEYHSNAKGYGLENVRIMEPGTYGWIAKVVDSDTGDILYEGNHGDAGEVFSVYEVGIHTKASNADIYLGEPISDTVILEDTVPDGYYVIVDLYKFSDQINDFENAEQATEADIVWTSEKIKVSASGEYQTKTFTPTEIGSYGFVEKLYDQEGNVVHEGKKGEPTENFIVRPKIKIGTSAKDQETGINEGNANDENGLPKETVTIVDTVSYENLVIGRDYTIKGILMVAADQPFKDAEGNTVTVTKTFTAEQENGTIDLTFVVNKTDMQGKTVVVFEKLYEGEKEVAAHEDLTDKGQTVSYPDIGTKAAEVSIHGTEVIIEDIVSYDNLIPDKEYTINGVLMDKETKEVFKVDDEAITGEATFTANKQGKGTVKVTFKFDRNALAEPKNLVVFEKLYTIEGKLVGTHEDIEDEDQTVEVKPEVELKTSAIDKETEMHEGNASDEEVTIVDTVSYKHLIVDKQYTVKGVLMDKTTGEPFLVKRKGKWTEVHAEKTFFAKTEDGTIDLEFIVEKGDLAGKTVVVFETLYYEDVEIGAHADIEDEAQTVSYPKVGTQAAQTSSSTEEKVVIQDMVSYENLIPGQEYTVDGVLMDKNTGTPFLADNQEVTGTATFTASETGSGTVEVGFTFLRSALTEDTVLVVFEKLYNAEGKLVGTHEELEDEDQTIRQPQVATKAKDQDTGTQEGFADDDVTVVDEVSYKNLVVGQKYTVKGILMDKTTGQPFLTRDGQEVRAEQTFEATQRDGVIELVFHITKGDLAGKTIVVFETLYQEDREVATHADIEDEAQMVHYPKVGTQAAEISQEDDAHVVIGDIVYYENLIPGASYTVRGQLMVKASGQPFTILGRPAESQLTFVASDTGTGTVTMNFIFSRSLLAEEITLVVFERLYDTKGNLIGAHEDITDPAQTVAVKPESEDEPSTPTVPSAGSLPTTGGKTSYSSSGGSLPGTGDTSSSWLPVIGVMILAAIGIYLLRRRSMKE